MRLGTCQASKAHTGVSHDWCTLTPVWCTRKQAPHQLIPVTAMHDPQQCSAHLPSPQQTPDLAHSHQALHVRALHLHDLLGVGRGRHGPRAIVAPEHVHLAPRQRTDLGYHCAPVAQHTADLQEIGTQGAPSNKRKVVTERKRGKGTTCRRWCVLGKFSCMTALTAHKPQHTLQLQRSRVQAGTAAAVGKLAAWQEKEGQSGWKSSTQATHVVPTVATAGHSSGWVAWDKEQAPLILLMQSLQSCWAHVCHEVHRAACS